MTKPIKHRIENEISFQKQRLSMVEGYESAKDKKKFLKENRISVNVIYAAQEILPQIIQTVDFLQNLESEKIEDIRRRYREYQDMLEILGLHKENNTLMRALGRIELFTQEDKKNRIAFRKNSQRLERKNASDNSKTMFFEDDENIRPSKTRFIMGSGHRSLHEHYSNSWSLFDF